MLRTWWAGSGPGGRLLQARGPWFFGRKRENRPAGTFGVHLDCNCHPIPLRSPCKSREKTGPGYPIRSVFGPEARPRILPVEPTTPRAASETAGTPLDLGYGG